MNYFQILSCSNDLGSCCHDKSLLPFFSVTNNIMSLIQIIVPIILLVMLSIDLMYLMMNPDDKKKLKSIRNKFIATIVVFMIPIFVNVVTNIISESGSKSFNFAACMKEAKNVKVDTKANYIEIDDGDSKPIISDPGKYDNSKPKQTSTSSAIGERVSSNKCTVGDGNVKLVPNDSKVETKIVRKANNEEVINYAKSWIGKMSYDYNATGELKSGGKCSCSHFVYQVLKHFGIVDKYGRSTVWGSCGVKGTVMYSNYNKLVPGDVVFMNVGSAVGHVGFYAGNGKVVDCNNGRGVGMSSNASKYTSFIHLSAYD